MKVPQPRGFRPAHMVQRRLQALGFAEKLAWLTHNLGRELGFITYDALEPCGVPVTSAGGFELLCSYNWRRRAWGKTRSQQVPQIYVPGEAPRVIPHALPHVARLCAQQRSFRDVNAAYMPRSPFEPMLRAVGVMRPDFRFDDVDLVVNRSSLNHLLRLADEGKCKSAFRLDLAMINDTLFITPLWKGVRDQGNYGRIFEQHFTQHSKNLRESHSHHRAILYSLGPLKIAVLCEIDACFSGFDLSWALQNWKCPQTPEVLEQVEAIVEASRAQSGLEQRLFANINKERLDLAGISLVTHRGTGTLSAHTAELTTSKFFGRHPKISQMWLGRTPYLIMSTHVDNTFTDIRAEHYGPRLQEYEVQHQDSLQKLVTAIKMLKQFTTSSARRHVIAVCTKQVRTLRVFEPTDEPDPPLPDSLQSRFWNKKWGSGGHGKRVLEQGASSTQRTEQAVRRLKYTSKTQNLQTLGQRGWAVCA